MKKRRIKNRFWRAYFSDDSRQQPLDRRRREARRRRDARRLWTARFGEHFVVLAASSSGATMRRVEWREPPLADDNDDDEAAALTAYAPPIAWPEMSARAPHYRRLIVDVNTLEFDHHWLFGDEDASATRLRRHHEDYVRLAERIVAAWHDFSTLTQRAALDVVGEREQQK